MSNCFHMFSHFCEIRWWLRLFLQVSKNEEFKAQLNRCSWILASRPGLQYLTKKITQDFQLNLNLWYTMNYFSNISRLYLEIA